MLWCQKKLPSQFMFELYAFTRHILKSRLLVLGFLIYFLFNLSALTDHFFDFFFFDSSTHHCCQGLDFYQVPNAAYAFFHGGELTGSLPDGIKKYSQNYVTNWNVYHPLLTLTLGSFFILFDPEISIRLWTFIKIFVTLGVVYYIYKNFKENKYLNFALFIFLINFSQYNEIRISQYQFLFNVFLLFFLINLVKNKNNLEGGILYFLTLIAKPIGLLWIPVLLVKKKFSVLVLGSLSFAISTLTFYLLGIGQYFIDNVSYHIFHPMETNNIDFMSLEAILRNSFGISLDAVRIIKMITLGIIYLIAFSKRVNVLKATFLLVLYFLFFYDLVFQYHFSVLGPLLSICLLALSDFQTRFARILILIVSLPNTFFVFRLLNLGIVNNPVLGADPIFKTQQIVSFFQILPILLLVIIVLVPDIKFYLGKLRVNKNVSA